MASTTSAGLVLVRDHEVLLVHPGGPFWENKDDGVWSIPKGQLEKDEEPLAAAIRETCEELGIEAPSGPFVSVGEIRLKSGKRVLGWACAHDVDVALVKSNLIVIEWPPRSGKLMKIPEIDRAVWASLDEAKRLVNAAQIPLLERALALTL